MSQQRCLFNGWGMVLALLGIVASSTAVAHAQTAQIMAHADTLYTHGVLGRSYDFIGVVGISDGEGYASHGVEGSTNSTSSANAGVFGHNSGGGPGVTGHGTATNTGYGVRAWAQNAHAIYSDSDSSSGVHYGGFFTGPQGVYAQSEVAHTDAITAQCTAGGACFGLDVDSDTSYAISAGTGRTDNNYGVYTPDNIYSLNYHTSGGLSLIVRNLPESVPGAASLERGEVVALTGIAPPPPGMDRPVVQVARADWTATGGLLGVVETAYEITMVKRPKLTFVEQEFPNPEGGDPDVLWMPLVNEDHEVPVHEAVEGPVPPGGYAVVRVLGLAQVKAAALAGQLLPGDALQVASIGGAAVLGNHVGVEGAPVVAHALEALPAGTEGLIWAVVGTP